MYLDYDTSIVEPFGQDDHDQGAEDEIVGTSNNAADKENVRPPRWIIDMIKRTCECDDRWRPVRCNVRCNIAGFFDSKGERVLEWKLQCVDCPTLCVSLVCPLRGLCERERCQSRVLTVTIQFDSSEQALEGHIRKKHHREKMDERVANEYKDAEKRATKHRAFCESNAMIPCCYERDSLSQFQSSRATRRRC